MHALKFIQCNPHTFMIWLTQHTNLLSKLIYYSFHWTTNTKKCQLNELIKFKLNYCCIYTNYPYNIKWYCAATHSVWIISNICPTHDSNYTISIKFPINKHTQKISSVAILSFIIIESFGSFNRKKNETFLITKNSHTYTCYICRCILCLQHTLLINILLCPEYHII